MRGGVIAHGVRPVAADFERRAFGPTLMPPSRDLADVQHRIAEPLRVLDFEGAGRRRDRALVADLAALLRVEVRLVQEQGEPDRRV